MFQAFSRLFVLIASASFVVGNGTQIIDWHALNDAEPNQDDSQIRLILYSRKWRDGTADMTHVKKKLHTFVLIHGFNDNLKDSIMLPLLTKNYLDRERCNVVVVDWAEFAKGPWFINAAKNTLLVGKELAAWLDTSGLDMKRVTLVGFSMGAHIAGDAGHFAKKRVSRIVALDPAHFLFQNSPPEFRLDSSDAEIVEVVHTSGGYVGEKEALGTRDFFPNGGSYPQPGCSPDPTGTCSHRRAYYYYSEAILRPDDNFRARRCHSYDHFIKHKCREKGKPMILHLVNSNQDKLLTGNFYFTTNSKEPFIRRNISNNASSTTEKHPTTLDKHRKTFTDHHQSTAKVQSTTTVRRRSTEIKEMTTTDKKRPSLEKYRLTTTGDMQSWRDRSTTNKLHLATTEGQKTIKMLTTGKDRYRERLTTDKYSSYYTTNTRSSLRDRTTNKHRFTSTDEPEKNSHPSLREKTTTGKYHSSTTKDKASMRETTEKHRLMKTEHSLSLIEKSTLNENRSTTRDGKASLRDRTTNRHSLAATVDRVNLRDWSTTERYRSMKTDESSNLTDESTMEKRRSTTTDDKASLKDKTTRKHRIATTADRLNSKDWSTMEGQGLIKSDDSSNLTEESNKENRRSTTTDDEPKSKGSSTTIPKRRTTTDKWSFDGKHRIATGQKQFTTVRRRRPYNSANDEDDDDNDDDDDEEDEED